MTEVSWCRGIVHIPQLTFGGTALDLVCYDSFDNVTCSEVHKPHQLASAVRESQCFTKPITTASHEVKTGTLSPSSDIYLTHINDNLHTCRVIELPFIVQCKECHVYCKEHVMKPAMLYPSSQPALCLLANTQTAERGTACNLSWEIFVRGPTQDS